MMLKRAQERARLARAAAIRDIYSSVRRASLNALTQAMGELHTWRDSAQWERRLTVVLVEREIARRVRRDRREFDALTARIDEGNERAGRERETDT